MPLRSSFLGFAAFKLDAGANGAQHCVARLMRQTQSGEYALVPARQRGLHRMCARPYTPRRARATSLRALQEFAWHTCNIDWRLAHCSDAASNFAHLNSAQAAEHAVRFTTQDVDLHATGNSGIAIA
jgi:hypothetical protein